MDALKQRQIDICRINIEEDMNWLKIAGKIKDEGLFKKVLADKEYHEKKLEELMLEVKNGN